MNCKYIIVILTLILLIGCAQQPIEPTTPIEEPTTEPEQICTEMWLCQDANTKAYRKSDCTFEQITDCPAGCENGECKPEEIAEEPEQAEETKAEQGTEECTIGYTCMDDKRRGYRTSDCMFSNVDECEYGCKDNECIKDAPIEEVKEEAFTLTEGKLIMNKTGWKSSDFSKNQIFLDEVHDRDVKIKLYASASDYDYFRAESYLLGLWIIEKEISEATRSDCTENFLEENYYQLLRSEQTLCIQTREKDTALIGGSWEGLPKEDTELTWKYYTPK